MCEMRLFDVVYLRKETEVANGLYIKPEVIGVVKDRTVPNYYLVNFEGYGAYWVDGKHLTKHK